MENKNITLLDYIKSDLKRLTPDANILSFFRWYFFPQGSTFPHTVWFRILQNCKKKKVKKYTIGLIAYFRERHFSFKYGNSINANTDVGQGMRIVHGNGVYINCKKVGSNFTCFQCVTLGGANGGVPIVEDNVTVYTGAVVAGNITLHKGCTIAANAYVGRDVNENQLVAGVPAKHIK